MDNLRGQFIDIVEFLDDSRDTHRVALPAARQRDQERRAAGRARGPDRGLRQSEGTDRRRLHARARTRSRPRTCRSCRTSRAGSTASTRRSRPRSTSSATRLFTDLKWGTQNPITLRDAEFGMVRLRAFGTYALQVVDPAKLLRQLVGTDPQFRTDEVGGVPARRPSSARSRTALATSNLPMLDLAANQQTIAATLGRHAHHQPRRHGRRDPALRHREHLAAARGRGGPRQAHVRWGSSATSTSTRSSRPRPRSATPPTTPAARGERPRPRRRASRSASRSAARSPAEPGTRPPPAAAAPAAAAARSPRSRSSSASTASRSGRSRAADLPARVAVRRAHAATRWSGGRAWPRGRAAAQVAELAGAVRARTPPPLPPAARPGRARRRPPALPPTAAAHHAGAPRPRCRRRHPRPPPAAPTARAAPTAPARRRSAASRCSHLRFADRLRARDDRAAVRRLRHRADGSTADGARSTSTPTTSGPRLPPKPVATIAAQVLRVPQLRRADRDRRPRRDSASSAAASLVALDQPDGPRSRPRRSSRSTIDQAARQRPPSAPGCARAGSRRTR